MGSKICQGGRSGSHLRGEEQPGALQGCSTPVFQHGGAHSMCAGSVGWQLPCPALPWLFRPSARGGPAVPHLNVCLSLTFFVFPSQTLELDMTWFTAVPLILKSYSFKDKLFLAVPQLCCVAQGVFSCLYKDLKGLCSLSKRTVFLLALWKIPGHQKQEKSAVSLCQIVLGSFFLSGVCFTTPVYGQILSWLQKFFTMFERNGQKSGNLPQDFLHTAEYRRFQVRRGV